MLDGSTPAQAGNMTIHLDGDLQAVPLISDLAKAGLRLVQEDGKTLLRRSSDAPDPTEVIPEGTSGETTILEILSGIRLHLNSASKTAGYIARALELVERAEAICRRQAATGAEAIDRHQEMINRENAANVRAFLTSVRPLKDVCYCSNETFWAGWSAIDQLATAIDIEREQAFPDIGDCIDILFFLSNIQSLDGGNCYAHSAQGVTVGYNIVLDHILETVAEFHEKHEKHN